MLYFGTGILFKISYSITEILNKEQKYREQVPSYNVFPIN